MKAATAMTIAPDPVAATRRFLIERTFPVGALDGVDAAAKEKVNANNMSQGVVWEKSYTNAAMTRTYCIYRAPSENAGREAARLNGLPVDVVIEIPTDIKPEPRGAVHMLATGNHRYLVRRAGVSNVSSGGDGKFGVTLLTS